VVSAMARFNNSRWGECVHNLHDAITEIIVYAMVTVATTTTTTILTSSVLYLLLLLSVILHFQIFISQTCHVKYED